jgi:hypothetical protein
VLECVWRGTRWYARREEKQWSGQVRSGQVGYWECDEGSMQSREVRSHCNNEQESIYTMHCKTEHSTHSILHVKKECMDQCLYLMYDTATG